MEELQQAWVEVLFTQTLREVAPLAREISLHLMGDPLAHPKLCCLLEITKHYRLPVTITTAGHLMDEERMRLLMHPIVKQVNFSLNSFNENPKKWSFEFYLERLSVFLDKIKGVRDDLFVNWRLWNLKEGEESSFNL